MSIFPLVVLSNIISESWVEKLIHYSIDEVSVYWYIMKHKHDKVTLKQYNIQTGESKDYGPEVTDECSSVQSLGLYGATGAPAPYVLCLNSGAYFVQYLSSNADEWHGAPLAHIAKLQKVSLWSSGELTNWFWTILTKVGLYILLESPTGDQITLCQTTRTSNYLQSILNHSPTYIILLNEDRKSVSICDACTGSWSEHSLEYRAYQLKLVPNDENSVRLISMVNWYNQQWLNVYNLGW